MSDAEDEVEEDPRIAQLYNFASKRYDDDGKYTGEPQELVDYVAKLGTDKAIVHGSMMLNPAVARAYFIVMALIDADGEDEPTVAECVTLRRTALKACVADGGADAAQMLLAALESYVARMEDTKDRGARYPARCPARNRMRLSASVVATLPGPWCAFRSARFPPRQVAGYDAVLKVLWEWEIVDEDTLRAWVADERAGRHFGVPLGVARPLREGAGKMPSYAGSRRASDPRAAAQLVLDPVACVHGPRTSERRAARSAWS